MISKKKVALYSTILIVIFLSYALIEMMVDRADVSMQNAGRIKTKNPSIAINQLKEKITNASTSQEKLSFQVQLISVMSEEPEKHMEEISKIVGAVLMEKIDREEVKIKIRILEAIAMHEFSFEQYKVKDRIEWTTKTLEKFQNLKSDIAEKKEYQDIYTNTVESYIKTELDRLEVYNDLDKDAIIHRGNETRGRP